MKARLIPVSRLRVSIALLSFLMPLAAVEAAAQGTAFTYQGHLNDGPNPANGSYDLRFSVYGVLTGGSAVAGPITNATTSVSNGLFTATLDFGQGVFTGSNCWLDIGVRTNGAVNFTAMAPRQPLTPVPYAIFAATASNLSGTLPSGQLNGTYSGPVNFTNNGNMFNGSFAGNAAGLTNLNPLGSVADSLQQYTVTDVERGHSQLLKPPFGYNTWVEYGTGITEAIATNTVNTLKTNGLLDFCNRNHMPFIFNFDDFFIQGADPVTLLPSCNPATFPHGVAWMLNYLWTNGITPGVYICGGTTTPNYAAPYQGPLIPGVNEEKVALFLVTNHVGYVKYDGFGGNLIGSYLSNFFTLDATNLYSSARFMQAMKSYSTTPVFFNAPVGNYSEAGGYFINAWRTFGTGFDLDGNIVSSDADYNSQGYAQLAQFFWLDAATNANMSSWSGPWHTPDFGNVGASVDAGNLVQMILRCIFGAPIILGDIRTNGWQGGFDDYRIYTNNPNLLAIDWDQGFQAPFWAGTNNGCYFYVRPLGSADSTYKALAIFNRNYTMPNNKTYQWYPTNVTFPLANAGYSGNQMILIRNVGGQVDGTPGICSYLSNPSYGYILVSNSVAIPVLDGLGSAMLTLTPTNALPLPYVSNVVSLLDWQPFWQTNLGRDGAEHLQGDNPFSVPNSGIGSNNVICAQCIFIQATNWFAQYGIYGATNFSCTLGYDNYYGLGSYHLTNYSRWVILIDGVTNYDSQNWGPIGIASPATNISLALSGTAQIMTIRYFTYGANFSVGDLGNPSLAFVPPLANVNADVLGASFLSSGSIVNNGTLTNAGNAMFQGSVDISGSATASNEVFGANNLLTGSLGDARYVQLGSLTNSSHTTNVTKTANYALLVTESGAWFNNFGAVATNVWTLPSSSVGLHYWGVVGAAQTTGFKAQGTDTVRIGASVSAPGGAITSSAVGSVVHIFCPNPGVWYCEGVIGTWTVN